MMTEHEALAKLGAKDWRSLKKKQIMTFFLKRLRIWVRRCA